MKKICKQIVETLNKYENKFFYPLSMFLTVLIFIAFLHLAYAFITAEVTLPSDIVLLVNKHKVDSRSSMGFLFSGLLAGVFILAFSLFILKFFCNCIVDIVKKICPKSLYNVVKLLIILLFTMYCFNYVTPVKILMAHAVCQSSALIDLTRKNETDIGKFKLKIKELTHGINH